MCDIENRLPRSKNSAASGEVQSPSRNKAAPDGKNLPTSEKVFSPKPRILVDTDMAQHCSFAMCTTRARGSHVRTPREHGATHVATTDDGFEDVFS